MLCSKIAATRNWLSIYNKFYRTYMYSDRSSDGRWSGKRNLWRHTLVLNEEQWPQNTYFSSFLFALLLTLNKRWRRKRKIYKNRILFPVKKFFLCKICCLKLNPKDSISEQSGARTLLRNDVNIITKKT